MSEHEIPRAFEDAIRAALAFIVASGPNPDDARLDALETRTALPTPRSARMILAAAAVVLALLGLGAVVVRSGGDDEHLATGGSTHPCGAGASEEVIELPAPYSGEDRLLVPLTRDLGRGGPTGTPTIVPAVGTAELRYPNGEVIRFTTAPGSARDAAPSPFPTSDAEAEAQGSVRSITSGMTATGDVTTVKAPVPIRRQFLEGVARGAAELPETMATAAAAGRAFPEFEQTFELDGHTFERRVQFNDGQVLAGIDLVSEEGGGVGGELSLMVSAIRPDVWAEFEAGGHYQWLVFIPAGLDVTLDTSKGDRCTGVATDELTGGEYWLINDGNGDEKATTETATRGSPTKTVLSQYTG